MAIKKADETRNAPRQWTFANDYKSGRAATPGLCARRAYGLSGVCRVMLVPRGTNTEKPSFVQRGGEDALLWARNKWLLAHAASDEAAQGAYVGLAGENIDISDSL